MPSDRPEIDEIAGSEALTKVFGRWPSFHDAEVLWIKLDRDGEELDSPTLEAMVHVFEITNEVGEDGSFKLRNHLLVHFQFVGVVELQLSDFNQQNALFGLAIHDLRGRQLEFVRFEVHFDGAFGVDASFQCRTIEVISVASCDEDGNRVP